MTKFKVKANLSGIQAKSPEYRKKAVTYVANELLKKCDPYVPFRTGMLRDSGIAHSVPKQGRLVWKTPYAENQWEYGKSRGLRGRLWAKRAWLDNRKYILSNAKSVAAGKEQP